MCQKCVEMRLKYYPHLSECDYFELLMGATCFPFGQPEMIEQQLVELLEQTDGSLNAALAYADKELTIEMKRIGG